MALIDGVQSEPQGEHRLALGLEVGLLAERRDADEQVSIVSLSIRVEHRERSPLLFMASAW